MDLTIYRYRVWDTQNDTYVIPRRMATREFIERARGEILEDTARTVDESAVNDGQEILDPAKGR